MSSIFVNLNESKESCLHLENNQLETLADGNVNSEYIIRDVESDDSELKNFLFSLGCFKGEKVTIISILAENFVISIKDARYSIDADLAEAIQV